MNTTVDYKYKFLIEIENNFKKIKSLRQRPKIARDLQKINKTMNSEYDYSFKGK